VTTEPTTSLELISTECAICGGRPPATELYPANFQPSALNPTVFSARRLPDRIHYRMVRCDACGLVRSDPTADLSTLTSLYRQSAFTYEAEVANLRATYQRYLRRALHYARQRRALLEIGCGTGFVLEEALALGVPHFRGVEPSVAAVELATPEVKPQIVCEMMRPGLFEPEQFDVVCMFQVLDHIPSPNELLQECFRLLRPGGVGLCLNHDVEAPSARVLRERSPIIDIEHTYLYSKATIAHLLARHGYVVQEVGPAFNLASVAHLLHLLPLPSPGRQALNQLVDRLGIQSWTLSLPLGNLFAVGMRP